MGVWERGAVLWCSAVRQSAAQARAAGHGAMQRPRRKWMKDRQNGGRGSQAAGSRPGPRRQRRPAMLTLGRYGTIGKCPQCGCNGGAGRAKQTDTEKNPGSVVWCAGG